MINFAREFGDYVAAIAGGMGAALIAALILLALSRVTLPALRRLWHRASPLGRIYQLQAIISDGVGGKASCAYRWKLSEDSNIGRCKKDDYKAIGVASEQWQLDLLNCARGFLGKTGYGLDEDCPGQYGFADVPAGSWKCNIFVAYRACQLGFNVPAMRKRYWVLDLPPLANDWAGSQRIEGWSQAQGNPQPGWIIAHPNSNGSGHVGITDFDGAGVAAGSKIVNRRFKNWQDGTSVYRRKE